MADEPTTPIPTPAVEPVAPAPAPAPPTEVGVEPDETSAFVMSAFDPMTQDFDEVESDPPPSPTPEPEPTASAEVTAPPTPIPAAVQPTVSTTPAPAPVAPATPAPVIPAVAAPVPQPGPAAPSPVSPSVTGAVAPVTSFDELAEGLGKQKDAFVKALAEHQYKLSDEDLQRFNEDPRSIIQEVAARVQVETTASVLKVLSQQMPVQVNALLQANQRSRSAEDEFWAANSFLDRKTHRETAGQVMQAVRQMNPNMDKPTFIRTVGIMTAGLAGVNPMAQPATRPAISTPGPVVRQTNGGFVPAGATSAPPSAHPAPQKNEWERLTELYVLDEGGAFDR